jgi:acetyl coenzyme A synthetase (ADP forming)-like protein
MQSLLRSRVVPPPYQDAAESGRVILRDGATAQIRPAEPADQDALTRFFCELSEVSRYRRFQSASLPGPEVIARIAAENDPASAFTLVIAQRSPDAERIIATGSYLARDDQTAEVALAVADAYQCKGLGTLLLERLALLAARHGFTRFWALTTPDNCAMLRVFHESGFDVQSTMEGGGIEVDLTLAPTATSLALQELRDRIAAVASLAPFFRPRAVAVVGASRHRGNIGYQLLDSLVQAGFAGPIYPVNPKAVEIAGLKTYRSVLGVPVPVDLAVIVAPASSVLEVVDDCAAQGVRALVVISAGFAEVGADGAKLQQELRNKVIGYGMRMVGPNCLGLLNTDPDVRLNASFSRLFPPRGRIAMSSQSGAVGYAVLGVAQKYQLGFSTFVSVGNKADVSGNDLLQFWEDDPATDVILLYMESLGNPQRFSRIARRVARKKPIVVLQSGLTSAGKRAAGSHTAALATNAAAVEALFRQTGVIRANSMEDMFDLARFFSSQKPPVGSRIAIVTNSGGPAILCADACEAAGLGVPEPSPALKACLKEVLPAAASVVNPVDLIAGAGPTGYRHICERVLASGEYDALVVIYTTLGLSKTEDIAAAIVDGVSAARRSGGAGRPVLVSFLGQEEQQAHLECEGERIPCYSFPEATARVLGKAAAYGRWLAEPPGVFVDFDDLQLNCAAAICRNAAAARGDGWLSAEEVSAVLQAVGLREVPTCFARSADEVVAAARKLGYPVAVKLASRRFIHKSEINGVRLNLGDDAAVRTAYEEIRARVESEHVDDGMDGVVVQAMFRSGIEVMAGVTRDPVFGPLIAFGLGGVFVEVMADVSFCVAPLTDRDAAGMVRGIHGYRMLTGYRGNPAADVEAIEAALLRLSRLVEETPEISEMDLNPIFALPPGEGCRIADARIRVRPAPSRPGPSR